MGKNLQHYYIKQIFTNWYNLKTKGIYFSGIEGNGEYKLWYSNGNLWIHCFYKDGKLEDEYKRWYENGNLAIHSFYKDGKFEGEYKQWNINGKLRTHCFLYNNKEVADFIKHPELKEKYGIK